MIFSAAAEFLAGTSSSKKASKTFTWIAAVVAGGALMFPQVRGQAVPPANDVCANAIQLPVGGTIVGTTLGATIDSDITGDYCGTSIDTAGVWYTLTGTGNVVRVSMCDGEGGFADFDTKISVFSSDCSNAVCIGGNGGFFGGTGFCSAVSFGTANNVNYRILVHGYGGQVGTFTLAAVDFVPPQNDVCANAIQLPVGGTISGTTVGATIDSDIIPVDPEYGVPFCGTRISTAGVWYTLTGTGNVVLVSTCDIHGGFSGFDTKISVFSSDCSDAICIDGNDDYNFEQEGVCAAVSFGTANIVNYRILVHGFGGRVGNFTLAAVDLVPPPNDVCANAIQLPIGGTISGTTVGATIDTDIIPVDPNYGVPVCGTSITAGVWYTLTGTGNVVRVSTCDSEGGSADFGTKISVFSSDCSNAICIGGNGGVLGLCSAFSFGTVNNENYRILVHGSYGSFGTFTLAAVDLGQALLNDLCANAIHLPIGGTISGTTVGATIDSDIIPVDPEYGVPYCGAEISTEGVWYSLTGNGNVVRVSTCDIHGGFANFDTKISVFSSDCSDAICIGGNDSDGCSAVSFGTANNVNYRILVHGFGGLVGTFTLAAVDFVPPPNDMCANAIQLPIGGTIVGTTLGATIDSDIIPVDPFYGVPVCGTFITAGGVWYNLTGTGNVIRVSMCDSEGGFADFDTKISVFSSDCNNAVCIGGNDDSCDLSSAVSFGTANNVNYRILVHGYNSQVGTFTLAAVDLGPCAAFGGSVDTECFTDKQVKGCEYCLVPVNKRNKKKITCVALGAIEAQLGLKACGSPHRNLKAACLDPLESCVDFSPPSSCSAFGGSVDSECFTDDDVPVAGCEFCLVPNNKNNKKKITCVALDKIGAKLGFKACGSADRNVKAACLAPLESCLE